MGRKLSLPYVDISFDVPKGKFILKNNSLESWWCFRLFFFGGHKNNFVAPLRVTLDLILNA